MILTLTLVAAAAGAQPEQPLRRVVALLDYVSGDYAHAVGERGEVLSAAEHEEQIGFVQDAAAELRADVDGSGEDLARRLDALALRVRDRAPPSEVGQKALALRDEIAERFKLVLLPQRAPDLVRGAQVYAQACAACHGADGHPNQAIGLLTKPPDFQSEVGPLSPRRIFSASTYGVPKTQMPAFDSGLSDAERWDVAFYVLSLAHPGAAPRGVELARAALAPTGYAELASLSDDELRARLSAAGLAAQDQEVALAALRAGPFTEPAGAAREQGLAQARSSVQKAVAQARRGDRAGARGALISAYLDHFEAHEAGLRARDGKLVQDIEAAFLALRGSVDGKDALLEAHAARLDALLEKADARGAGGWLVAFVAALAIALREGAEAALLVAAMLALLRKAGREGDANAVHAGWLSALAAGAATWWASGVLLVRLSGTHRELIEGVLQLLLAALILYASHWLFAAMSSRRIVSKFFQRAGAGAGSAVVLGLTFVAVYREMFEVVLFFRGLLLEEPGRGATVAAGALLGLFALVVMVALFQRLGRKLKPRPLLMSCGLLLCGLAVLMVGNGIRSLQVLGLLPLTVWGAFQVPALGLYATREGLLAQALVLGALLASALWTSRRRDAGKSGPAKREVAAPAQ
jgi:high-affinity iron transporter